MEQIAYRITLSLTGIYVVLLAVIFYYKGLAYRRFTNYYRSRLFTVVWFASFGIGFLLHSIFLWRYSWPAAASALTTSYFHIGAICFSWGYIPLMNPNYLTRKIILRDSIFYAFALLAYWTVPFLWQQSPLFTFLSFCVFFTYAGLVAVTFYRTYNKVSYRMIHMPTSSIKEFIRWMQVCCDYIVLFGICSVVITALFPIDASPYTILLLAGAGMFTYMAYSLHNYGKVVERDSQTNDSTTQNIYRQ